MKGNYQIKINTKKNFGVLKDDINDQKNKKIEIKKCLDCRGLTIAWFLNAYINVGASVFHKQMWSDSCTDIG